MFLGYKRFNDFLKVHLLKRLESHQFIEKKLIFINLIKAEYPNNRITERYKQEAL